MPHRHDVEAAADPQVPGERRTDASPSSGHWGSIPCLPAGNDARPSRTCRSRADARVRATEIRSTPLKSLDPWSENSGRTVRCRGATDARTRRASTPVRAHTRGEKRDQAQPIEIPRFRVRKTASSSAPQGSRSDWHGQASDGRSFSKAPRMYVPYTFQSRLRCGSRQQAKVIP
jgi:hypothetical protein